MLVSEMEKKAEITSRTTNAISSVWSGISSKCSHQLVEKSKSVSAAAQTVSRQRSVRAPSAMQQYFEHEFAADVGENQRKKTGKRPTHGHASAPTVEHAPRKQRCEDDPGEDAEYRLVGE